MLSPRRIASVSLLMAALAHAQEDEIKAVITVLGRQILSEGASITIIDRDAIEASGAPTVAELLAVTPGIHLLRDGSRGGLSVPFLRGGDPNLTLVLWDGVPLNDPTDSFGGTYDLATISCREVERIEIIRGPFSSLFGSKPVAGIIHVIGRKPADATSAGVEAAAGSFSLGRGAAELSGPAGAVRYRFSLQGEREDGRVGDEAFRQGVLAGSLAIPLAEERSLDVSARLVRSDVDDYPDASGGPELGSELLRESESAEASASMRLDLGGKRRLHQIALALHRHDRDRNSPGVFPLVPPSVESTTLTRARLGWLLGLLATRSANLIVGADVEHEDGENESLLSLPPEYGGPVRGDYDISRSTAGAFIELGLSRERAGVELSLRLDVPEGFDRQWNPRVAGFLAFQGTPTRLRASVGRAYKAPSFFALASPPALGGNPDLDPETSIGADIGLDYGDASDRLSGKLSLFGARYRDLVDFDFDTFRHVNRTEVEAVGLEVEVAYHPSERLTLGAAVTRQDVERTDSDEPLRHRPDLLASIQVLATPVSSLQVGFAGRYVSDYADEQIPVPTRASVDDYAVVDAWASWQAHDRVRLDARAENLADADYETLIGYPGPGRSFAMGVTLRLR